jgi:hypothetical protein
VLLVTWRSLTLVCGRRPPRPSARAGSTQSGCHSWFLVKASDPCVQQFAHWRHLRFVERSTRKLARNTFYGMARWQAKTGAKAGFLGRIVDIGAELFAMSAACGCAEGQRVADPTVGQQA